MMIRYLVLLLLLILPPMLFGCGSPGSETLAATDQIALLTVTDRVHSPSQLPAKEMQRVQLWLERDLHKKLRHQGYSPFLLDELKAYDSTMGSLLIINFIYYNPGARVSGDGSADPSSLELHYRLLDVRGALVTEWQDKVESRRGGTYCAQALNRRAAQHLSRFLTAL